MDRDFIDQPRPRIAPRGPVERPMIRFEDRSRFKQSVSEQAPIQQPKPQPSISQVDGAASYPTYKEVPVHPAPQAIAPAPPAIIKPQPYTQPAQPKLQTSQVLSREYAKQPVQIAQTEEYQAEPSPSMLDYLGSIKLPKAPRLNTINFANRKTDLMIGVAVISVIGFGLGTKAFFFSDSAKSGIAAISKSSASASIVPSEVKPTVAAGSNQVAPSEPKTISAPIINLKARVIALDPKDGEGLVVPDNIHDIGWYKGSAKPGDTSGAILIDGYAEGPTRAGVFSAIATLLPGDFIQVTRGDEKVFNFKVVKAETYDAKKFEMKNMLNSIDPKKLGLNLVSNGGAIDTKTGDYKNRTVVFAVQMD